MKLKTTSRWRYILLSAAMVCVVIVGYQYFFDSPDAAQYLTAPVSRGNLESTVLASGTVEAENLVSVGAQVSGQITSIKVELGDSVKAGDPIAEIDSLAQQNTLKNNEAALALVKAKKQAKKATLSQTERAYTRFSKMIKKEAASQADFESAEAALLVTKAEIAALDAEIAQAEIAVDTARINLGYTRITSPIDGVVVAVVSKEGQTVNATQSAPTIVKVANLNRMSIRVEISEADVIRVKPGLPVYFTLLGEPDQRYETQLESIEPAPESVAEESSTNSASTASSSSSTSEAVYYIGTLDVPNTDGRLRISMTTQVNIVLDRVKNCIIIPAAALGEKERDGRYQVRIDKGQGQMEVRHVKIGINNNVQTEVLEGVSEGEQVVIGEAAAEKVTSTQSGRSGPPPGMM